MATSLLRSSTCSSQFPTVRSLLLPLPPSLKPLSTAITPTLDGLTLSPDSLSSIASNPLQALGGLLGELASLTTCVGGVLSLLPGNFLDDLTALPNIITSLIGGIPRVVEAVEGTVCNALPEVCAAVGLDGGDAAAPTDLLPTGLACILAPALCTLLGLTGGGESACARVSAKGWC